MHTTRDVCVTRVAARSNTRAPPRRDNDDRSNATKHTHDGTQRTSSASSPTAPPLPIPRYLCGTDFELAGFLPHHRLVGGNFAAAAVACSEHGVILLAAQCDGHIKARRVTFEWSV